MTGEKAAHIATPADNTTTIFNVLACDALSSLLRPSANQLLKSLAQWKPQYFWQMFEHRNKIWILLKSSFDYYFLNYYSGTFCESFYGLSRHPTDPRSKHWRIRSLLVAVLRPFIQEKLENLFEKWRLDIHDGKYRDKSLKSSMVRLFVALYPWLHGIWNAVDLTYILLYTTMQSRHPNLSLRLASAVLYEGTSAPSGEGDSVSGAGDLIMESNDQPALLRTLRETSWRGFSTGILFLQFLHWWYSSSSSTDENSDEGEIGRRATGSSLSLQDIPPPNRDFMAHLLPADSSICPICHKKRHNPAVVNRSGIVYCYPCIFRHIEKGHNCPVTHYPITHDNIVRLFDAPST